MNANTVTLHTPRASSLRVLHTYGAQSHSAAADSIAQVGDAVSSTDGKTGSSGGVSEGTPLAARSENNRCRRLWSSTIGLTEFPSCVE
jgi:hypothetical protein